jgi:hypothetical protein
VVTTVHSKVHDLEVVFVCCSHQFLKQAPPRLTTHVQRVEQEVGVPRVMCAFANTKVNVSQIAAVRALLGSCACLCVSTKASA